MTNKRPSGHDERREKIVRFGLALLATAALLIAPSRPVVAQDPPRVTAVDPAMGSANDTVTVSGENLEKNHVAGVFLSDDKDDHKAVIVSQATDKIVIKVPAVKPGDYNISIQAGNAILIEPVHFTVQ